MSYALMHGQLIFMVLRDFTEVKFRRNKICQTKICRIRRLRRLSQFAEFAEFTEFVEQKFARFGRFAGKGRFHPTSVVSDGCQTCRNSSLYD